MHSVEIPADQIRTVRSVIPVGVEHYVVSKNGHRYINIRTDDPDLLAKLKRASEPAR